MVHHERRWLMHTNVVKLTAATARLEAMPIEPSQIVSGRPVARGVVALELDGGAYSTGVWECSPGTFHWRYEADETCTILKGEATVEVEGGGTVRFKAGDLVHFRKGMRTRWTVRKKILKTFILYG
jgi:uncharacterized cupin superfamily protein